MKPTIRDVAEAAGVSAMAVSKVLHGTGRNVRVGQDTADLIKKIAKELRYEPNDLARSFRSKRTQMIGVVFQNFGRLSEHNPYYPQLLNGIMAALFPAGYTLGLCPRLVHRSETGIISDGRFDGVLWCRPDFSEESVEGLRHSSTPVVMLHAPPGSAPGVPTFCANNDGALRLVIDHLMGLGHSHIAFVIEPLNQTTAEGKARTGAYVQAMNERNLKPNVLSWEVEAPDLKRYASDSRPHSALVCFSDTLAGYILERCKKLGISVPEELSVVGFDSSSFCETTEPRLTSVFQPVEQMAQDATNYLLNVIDQRLEGQPRAATSSLYDCRLDIRDSTERATSKRASGK